MVYDIDKTKYKAGEEMNYRRNKKSKNLRLMILFGSVFIIIVIPLIILVSFWIGDTGLVFFNTYLDRKDILNIYGDMAVLATTLVLGIIVYFQQEKINTITIGIQKSLLSKDLMFPTNIETLIKVTSKTKEEFEQHQGSISTACLEEDAPILNENTRYFKMELCFTNNPGVYLNKIYIKSIDIFINGMEMKVKEGEVPKTRLSFQNHFQHSILLSVSEKKTIAVIMLKNNNEQALKNLEESNVDNVRIALKFMLEDIKGVRIEQEYIGSVRNLKFNQCVETGFWLQIKYKIDNLNDFMVNVSGT